MIREVAVELMIVSLEEEDGMFGHSSWSDQLDE